MLINEIKEEVIYVFILVVILEFGLFLCDISNRQSMWEEAYRNHVYTAPEPEWPKDVPGQPLGYGHKNLGLTQKSEYWRANP